MVSIFDIIHYLISIIILVCLLWLLIQTHNYFSKDNNVFETLKNKNT
jgi:hypothetical protein